jgi:hypothetical protein
MTRIWLAGCQWVDASDPVWVATYERAARAHNQPIAFNRFREWHELLFSLRSIYRYAITDGFLCDSAENMHLYIYACSYAPWVRTIYLVTASQIPAWLDTSHFRVKVIPHRDLFPDPSVLPTFNSLAIESVLHLIPNLSPKFLYFNNDVFLAGDTTLSDFETSAGEYIIYHDWKITRDWETPSAATIAEVQEKLRQQMLYDGFKFIFGFNNCPYHCFVVLKELEKFVFLYFFPQVLSRASGQGAPGHAHPVQKRDAAFNRQ